MRTIRKRKYLFASALMVVVLVPCLALGQIRLPQGTEVTVKLQQDVSSKYAEPGDEIPIQLSGPIEVGGVVLVEAGATGTARVKSVETAGSGGNPGKIELELVGLDPEGNYKALEEKKIQLQAAEGEDGVIFAEGSGKGWFPWLFLKLFLKGGPAVIKADTPIKATVTESIFIVPSSE